MDSFESFTEDLNVSERYFKVKPVVSTLLRAGEDRPVILLKVSPVMSNFF